MDMLLEVWLTLLLAPVMPVSFIIMLRGKGDIDLRRVDRRRGF